MMNANLKKTLKNVSFWILMFKMCLIFAQKNVVVIDVGHGGKDPGAIGNPEGSGGIKEKEVVLNIAKEILSLNRTLLGDKFDIYLTRYKDTLISLSDRSRLTKVLKADVFVSLHCNHAENSNAKGIEVYIHNSDRENIKTSIGLGLSILNECTQKLGFKKRGVKFADFQVLRETIFRPAVLVEMGFMTNADESDYFLKPKNVRAMALTILIGITNYIKLEL